MASYNTAQYTLIYIFAIDDGKHNGMLKIGKTSFNSLQSYNDLPNNCPKLQQAARLRINQETKTARVDYTLLHTELAVKRITMTDGSTQVIAFDDFAVRQVILNSGYNAVLFDDSGRKSEWYLIDLDNAKKAIEAVKKGLSTIPDTNIPNQPTIPFTQTITLRNEQEDCVDKTIKWFKNYDDVLWDCKMRFGKTVTAYELIRRMNEQGKFKKTIVITHRPAVEDGWDSDHDLIFKGRDQHAFIDKSNGRIEFDGAIDAENDAKIHELVQQDKPFVYFASIQDLRGSARVKEGGFNKNNAVFDLDWDLIIIDEAHEGTRTELGDKVISTLKKPNTKILSLSGTPYNLINNFEENKYTWTYVDEQKAKKTWYEEHPNEKNPYEDLPVMNIYTFDLTEQLQNSYRYASEEQAFNFREFFRTWKGDIKEDYREIPAGAQVGDFVHADDVWAFLSLISEDNPNSNYPYSTPEFRNMFKHTFWLVPGVAAAKALSSMLQKHPRFKDLYHIVNIAGEGDEEEQYDKALALVKSSIASYSHTITISCGKLTTGVTVKEWTGIMMLSGSASTSASGYMQAIFRVQSPGCIDGMQKKNCYVFDFAPDRTLKVIAEVHSLRSKGKADDSNARIALGEFLNFCPIISCVGTEMKTYDVPELMRTLKKISVDNAIQSGFDDDTIYITNPLKGMNDKDQEVLRKLSDVVVPQKKKKRENTVVINNIGLTDEQRNRLPLIKKKKKKDLSPEEKEILEKEKKEREEAAKLYNLLRAVSIRLPLLFYGADADITKIIHLNDFVNIVDDESWSEFMPTGLSKELFLDILKFYDEDVVVGAGLRIRRLAKAADELPPTIRAKRIVEILSKFKNPDKETVLTPWRVVNMHLGETLGGYNFYDDRYENELEEPRFVDNGDITSDIFLNDKVKILEMNSKSGLYPLYMAYSIYMLNINGKEQDVPFEKAQEIWYQTIKDHIFVLCKTIMAKQITRRTLVGYSGKEINAIYLTKLIEERMKDIPRLTNKLTNPLTWNKGGDRMKFDAIVGNPPYQLENNGEGNGKNPIYHLFMDSATALAPIVTFIHPARFLFGAGKTPKAWNDKMLNDTHFKVIKYFPNSITVFPTADIKGGVAISIRDSKKTFGPIGTFNPYFELTDVLAKVKGTDFKSFSEIIYPRDLYRLTDELYRENPWAEDRQAKGHKYDVGSNIDEIFPELFTVIKPDSMSDYAQIYTKTKVGRELLWVKKQYLKLPNNFSNYKVFVPKANGRGSLGETLSSPTIGKPFVGCSATFLCIGNFNTEFEANAVLKYISTKFARALLSTLKATQNNPRESWFNIPQQDFTNDSDINWNSSISNIDQQLYKKYKLSSHEIEYIENNVKSMDGSSIYEKMLELTYEELVKFLLSKYGPAKHNYFKDTACIQKNPLVSRSDEGLFCHHIDEDKAIMLSNDHYAAMNPFEYQKADRLVYCNILEHLLLHIKIAEEPRNIEANKNELPGIGGAMNFIIKQINDYYGGYDYTQEHMIKAMSLIKNDFDDYIKILNYLWNVIQNNTIYSSMYKKEDLAKGWDDHIIDIVLENLK